MTETLKLSQQFEKDDLDEGLDISALPAPPWQLKTIGQRLFRQIATVMGAGDSLNKNPSLDPRTFGVGRANRQIHLLYLDREIDPVGTGPEGDITPEDYQRADAANVERLATIEAYKAEGQKLQDAINEGLPALGGTPRNPRAPKLTATKSTLKQSGVDPGFIKQV